MNCKNCGATIDDNAKFCENCGTPIDKPLDSFYDKIVPAREPIVKPTPTPSISITHEEEKPFWKKKYPEMNVAEKKKFNIILGGAIAVIAILILVFIISTTLPKDNSDTTIKDTSNLTYSKFQQIQTGMTYSEVCRILGKQGTLDSESSSDLGDGTQYRVAMYSWQENAIYNTKIIVIMFSNGKVDTKSQTGLA